MRAAEPRLLRGAHRQLARDRVERRRHGEVARPARRAAPAWPRPTRRGGARGTRRGVDRRDAAATSSGAPHGRIGAVGSTPTEHSHDFADETTRPGTSAPRVARELADDALGRAPRQREALRGELAAAGQVEERRQPRRAPRPRPPSRAAAPRATCDRRARRRSDACAMST